MKRYRMILLLVSITLSCVSIPALTTSPTPVSRQNSLPADTVKLSPTADAWPPVSAAGWSQPQPLDAPINTAGGEDSPFIPVDGSALYFFFTPDVRVPAEEQLNDGVTGIWVADKIEEGWEAPKRVILASGDELHLDGCPFVLGDWMLFCSVRESTAGEIRWFSAQRVDSVWADWQDWSGEIDPAYQVGELHISADGNELYFGSERPGGYGGFDIWMSLKTDQGWGAPINLGTGVNSAADENRPFLTADGAALWFDATTRSGAYYPGPAVFRSERQPDGTWDTAQEIVSQFAGEPVLSPNGNTLYFVHHYFNEDLSQMLEADIYVSHRIIP
ncbi:MAG: PD40 domain-containing protein [Anaerolineales bacterium]|nr:PD40 domain-containing protein [Anaerolineales bacterium]